jgi:hypothetical protein
VAGHRPVRQLGVLHSRGGVRHPLGLDGERTGLPLLVPARATVLRSAPHSRGPPRIRPPPFFRNIGQNVLFARLAYSSRGKRTILAKKTKKSSLRCWTATNAVAREVPGWVAANARPAMLADRPPVEELKQQHNAIGAARDYFPLKGTPMAVEPLLTPSHGSARPSRSASTVPEAAGIPAHAAPMPRGPPRPSAPPARS